MNKKYQIVIDTNVFTTALRSRRGASYKLLFENREKYELNISPALIFEYESIAKREIHNLKISEEHIESILDMICAISNKCEIFFLWRPQLKDPKDDHILELAIESQSKYIITYNKRDFKGVDKFEIEILTPKEFLEIIGEI
ncbi:MAG: putative toxin-antitoxin system toxin component, PIN family [Candidatus Marinimicrobia bacterium]|nr:putative toxin-antitoxin system toxin component, PIN family [Candidatus Neomarinimicrobiota bacterium]